MYLIEFITEKYGFYSFNNEYTKEQVGYKEDEESAKKYCERKTQELKGTYNEDRGCKYYQFKKLELIND